MKIKTLNEWLNESNQGFLEPTEENLRDYGLDHNKVTVNPDGSIDYDGNVDLSRKNLTSIPFKFNKVNGDFKCHLNQLVSLEGSPEVVGGEFRCFSNQLVSLEGCPEVVEGNFSCSSNRLASLAGAPTVVKGNFYCGGNQLVSLEGCPNTIKGEFRCSPNLILYNPTKYRKAFDINLEWSIQDSSGKWVRSSGSDHLRMAFGRLDELSREELLGIDEGLKKVDLQDDLRAYCENKLYKAQVKYNPKTKTQKFFHDLEMDDDLLGMI